MAKKYAQIRRNGDVVCLIGDETNGMPINSDTVYTINIEAHAQKDEVVEGMVYDVATNTFITNAPTIIKEQGLYGPFEQESVTATNAIFEDGNIVLELPSDVQTGSLVKFIAPCACLDVTSGVKIGPIIYPVLDAMKEIVTGVGGVWDTGAQVTIVIDNEIQKCYVQNGKTTLSSIGAAPTSHTHPVSQITGLGDAATKNVGTASGQVAAGNHTHTAADVHARPDTWTPTAAEVGADATGSAATVQTNLTTHINNKSNPHGVTAAQISAVPTSRKINSKALSADITLTAADVSAVPTTRTVNNKALSANISLTASDVGASASNHTHTAAQVGAVPTSRTVNNKALSSNISLTASDVGALSTGGSATISWVNNKIRIASTYGGIDFYGGANNTITAHATSESTISALSINATQLNIYNNSSSNPILIRGVLTPQYGNDAANKAYVDSNAGGAITQISTGSQHLSYVVTGKAVFWKIDGISPNGSAGFTISFTDYSKNAGIAAAVAKAGKTSGTIYTHGSYMPADGESTAAGGFCRVDFEYNSQSNIRFAISNSSPSLKTTLSYDFWGWFITDDL